MEANKLFGRTLNLQSMHHRAGNLIHISKKFAMSFNNKIRMTFLCQLIYKNKVESVEHLEHPESLGDNGMLRHSLATREGEKEFIDFYRALLSRQCSPLSLVGGIFSLFVSSTVCMHTCRPKGLPEGLQ